MSNCRSCGAEIFWGVTMSGKRMPLDVEPVRGLFRVDAEDDDETTVEVRSVGDAYRSHFATCPNADQHRKPTEDT